MTFLRVILLLFLFSFISSFVSARLTDEEFEEEYRSVLDQELLALEQSITTAKARKNPHRKWTRSSRHIGLKSRILRRMNRADEGSTLNSTLIRLLDLTSTTQDRRLSGSADPVLKYSGIDWIDCQFAEDQTAGAVCQPLTSLPTCSNSRYRLPNGECNNLYNRRWGNSKVEIRRLVPNTYDKGCFEENIAYFGSDLTQSNTHSAVECQAYCQQTDGCNFFTVNTQNGVCHLKLDNSERMVFEGYGFISGPKDCPDDIGEGKPTRYGVSGSPLPNPRIISSTIHDDVFIADTSVTNMLMQVGQFLDHDITLSPEEDRNCCPSDPFFENHPDCFPIDIPSTDNFYSTKSVNCLSFTRSTEFCSTSSVREPINFITAFIDNSNIYGSDEFTASILRAGWNGNLSQHDQLPGFLPRKDDVGQFFFEDVEGVFVSGDIRVNEMPALTSLHTLLFREHNRIANKLTQYLGYDDELLYQEARRIVVAQWQNIVYQEHLPPILGPELMSKFFLWTDRDSKYFPQLNPNIFNAFSTAAYRFGHSLINGVIRKYSNTSYVGCYSLRNNYNNDRQLYYGGLEQILEGLFRQPAQKFDRHVTEDISKFLFKEPGHNFGEDLISRNIQRGRDHGMGRYNDYRQLCGMAPLGSSWSNKPTEIPADAWAKLEEVYTSPLDIELFSAGLTESSLPGGIVGPTFGCLIAYQFFLLKHGDRYFFTHKETVNGTCLTNHCMDMELIPSLMDGSIARQFTPSSPFEDGSAAYSLNERNAIRNRTLGDILCDNTNMYSTSKTVFLQPDMVTNPTVACKGRPELNVKTFVSGLINTP